MRHRCQEWRIRSQCVSSYLAPKYCDGVVLAFGDESALYLPTCALHIRVGQRENARILLVVLYGSVAAEFAIEEILRLVLDIVEILGQLARFVLEWRVLCAFERVEFVANVQLIEPTVNGLGTIHFVEEFLAQFSFDEAEWRSFVVWHDIILSAVEGNHGHWMVAEDFKVVYSSPHVGYTLDSELVVQIVSGGFYFS